MEKIELVSTKTEDKNIKSMFDVRQEGDSDYPHTVTDASLRFEKEHGFESYKKQKTIEQYSSNEDEVFFKITRKRETQFLTSQILGGVIQASPIYIDEEGDYFSKKVAYSENIFDASAGLFILNVLANDWDHEIPYDANVKVRNYQSGSFFDFSHSDIATDGVQGSQTELQIKNKIDTWLVETERRLFKFAETKGLGLPKDDIRTELKRVLIEKMRFLQEFVSSEHTLKELYYKIGYYEKYQHELLDPEELREALVTKIELVISHIKSL